MWNFVVLGMLGNRKRGWGGEEMVGYWCYSAAVQCCAVLAANLKKTLPSPLQPVEDLLHVPSIAVVAATYNAACLFRLAAETVTKMKASLGSRRRRGRELEER